MSYYIPPSPLPPPDILYVLQSDRLFVTSNAHILWKRGGGRLPCTVCSWLNHGGINGAAQGGENDLRRWWGSVVYITSKKRTVRLGSLLGLYERFPSKK